MAVRKGLFFWLLGLVMLGIVRAATAVPPPRIQRVNVAADRPQSTLRPWFPPTLNGDGSVCAFSSEDAQLAGPPAYEEEGVYVRALEAQQTTLVGLSAAGDRTSGRKTHPIVSQDGRSVGFTTKDALAGVNTNPYLQAYVRDLTASTTELVSISPNGAPFSSRHCFLEALSGNARIAVFSTSDGGIYARDRQLGATELLTPGLNAAPAADRSWGTSISADGRYVAFTSLADNLVPNDTNHAADVFLRDRWQGLTLRVSVNSSGAQAVGTGGSIQPSISPDGRFVAFASNATNLTGVSTNGQWQIYVRDLATQTTELVSRSSLGGAADDRCQYPSISVGGGHVAFTSCADLDGREGRRGTWDVFGVDRATGAIERISKAANGTLANGESPFLSDRGLSDDGSRVAFWSSASNLLPGDTNGVADIFVVDRSVPAAEASTASGVKSTTAVAQQRRPIRPQVSALAGAIPAHFQISSAGALVFDWGSYYYGFLKLATELGTLFYGNGGGGTARGVVAAAWSLETGASILAPTRYDTWASDTQVLALNDTLRSLPHGSLVLLGVCDDGGFNRARSANRILFDTLRAEGCTLIQHYGFRDSYNAIYIAGGGTVIDEQLGHAIPVACQAAFLPESHTISGTVTVGGNPLPGVTVTAGGQSVTTAVDGTYAISGLAAGTYSVTPTLAEHDFLPVTRSITVGPSRSNVDFAGTRRTYSINCSVSAEGSGLAGVLVQAGSQSAITTADGTCTLTGLPAGEYVVTAGKSEFEFFPASHSVSVGPNRTGIEFTATRKTYSVSGTVKIAGTGLAGVVITMGGKTSTTGDDGGYTVKGLVAGSYTAVAAKSGYEISPTSLTVVVGPSQSGINFTATLPTFSISGKILDAGLPVQEATIAAGMATTTSGADGTYRLEKLTAGTYPVACTKTGYSFGPPKLVTVGPSQSGVDFVRQQLSSPAHLMLESTSTPGQVTLGVHFQANGAQVVSGAGLVAFPADKLSFVGVQAGALPAGVTVSAREQSPGRVLMVITGSRTAWASGRIASITFNATGATTGVTIPVELLVPGTERPGAHVTNAEAVLSEASAVGGTVTITGLMKGDANRNNRIDIGDVQLMVLVFLGAEAFDPAIHDINDDGVMNLVDVQALINLFLAGSPSTMPARSTAQPAAARIGRLTTTRLNFNPGQEKVTALAYDLDLGGGEIQHLTATLRRPDLTLTSRSLPSGKVRVLFHSGKNITIPAKSQLFTVVVRGGRGIKAYRPDSSSAGGEGARRDGTVTPVGITVLR